MYNSSLRSLFDNAYADDMGVKLCIDCVLSIFFVLIFAPLLRYGGGLLGATDGVSFVLSFCVIFIGIFYFGRVRV